jgi:hypothetical protein
MASMFGELGFEKGAEIGVRRGEYSEILCLRIKSLKKLYSVDPWDAVFEDPTGSYYVRKYGPNIHNRFYRQALRRLKKYPICEMIRKTSLEAVRDWARRVKKGGIVSGDDYQNLRRGNVIQAVDNYVEAHKIKILNIIEPPKEGKHNASPQWWFVKQ